MSDFKRSSSRFSKGGDSGGSAPRSSFQGGSRSSGPKPNITPNDAAGERRSYGGGSSSRPSNNGGGDFPFTRIASIMTPKSASDEAKEFIRAELRGSDLRLTAKVYLGKGDNELTLRNGDMLLIDFKVSDKDKDFVEGHISVKN